MATLKADCIKYGINYRTVQCRMGEHGMGRWEALLKPVRQPHEARKQPVKHKWGGKRLTVEELAAIRGVKPKSMADYIRIKGLSAAMVQSTVTSNRLYKEKHSG